MTVEHPRSDWTSTTSSGCAAMPTSGVTAVVYHWPGSEGSLVGKDVPSLLRGWRDYHVNQRGWCDIAYQWAVDLTGAVWELRGYDRRSAAQDAPTVPGSENDTMYAVLCILGQADTPTAAMVDGMRYLRGKALARTPAATSTLGHRDVSGDTECPGQKLLDIIHSGAVTQPSKGTGMNLTDVVTLTAATAADLGKTEATVSELLQWAAANAHVARRTAETIQAKVDQLTAAAIADELVARLGSGDTGQVTKADVQTVVEAALTPFRSLLPGQ